MISGGISESIWHFIGYMHLDETINRAEHLYKGFFRAKPAEDFLVKHLQIDAHPVEPLNMNLIRKQIILPPQPEDGIQQSSNRPQTHVKHDQAPPHASNNPSQTKPLELASNNGGGSSYETRTINVTYQEGGNQTLMDIEQVNILNTINTLSNSQVSLFDEAGQKVDLIVPNALPELQKMIMQAENAIDQDTLNHHELALMNHGDSGVIELVTARDAHWIVNETPTLDGRYVDGAKSDADIPLVNVKDHAPWSTTGTIVTTGEAGETITHTITSPTGGIGASAELGNNIQSNAAYIADVTSAPGSIIIGGDYYFTKAIIQVNVLSNNDHVDVASPDANAFANSIFTHGNEVHNVADFITHAFTGTYHGAASTYSWKVDTVAGNFYDVRSVDQVNNMMSSTSDIQVAHNTYFDFSSGHNQQGNFANIQGLDDYDLIVIKGSYHQADLIYQTNIVLNYADITLLNSGTGSEPSFAVSTGDNTLTNNAKIENYEGTSFSPLGSAQRDLMLQLEQHATELLPNYDWNLSGSATGVLKVLFVSGDYFHINAISQTNILSSVDIIGQFIPDYVSADGTFLNVSTGGNTANNTALIIDAGALSDSRFIGGTVYSDSMLSQSNLISDSDHIVIHDTHTLAPELIAFTDANNGDYTPDPAYIALHHHDCLSGDGLR
jgi:hypothetical protein